VVLEQTARSGPGPAISRPSSTAPPFVAGVSPATILSSVDFPQPECPMIETNSPFSIESVMPRSTSVSAEPRLKVLSM
jgi:hypothetical protein